MKLVLTGGGTGGHVYPALALAEAFAREPAVAPLEVTFVGTRAGLEATIVPKAGGTIRFVRAAALQRKLGVATLATLVTNVVGFVDALRVLHAVRPDVLIATGGYVSLPVVAALRAVRAVGRSRARIAVLEPNAVAGLTNRLLGPLVDEIWYALTPTGRALRANEFVVGTPVRASMRRALEPSEARTSLGLEPAKTTIVVMGGSQGARSINGAVVEFVNAGLPRGWQMLVLTGTRDYERVRARLDGQRDVTVSGYLDDPRVAYAAADVVVARAGASTLGELAATGTPALLVPYPFATADHQAHNARVFASAGGAHIVADGDLNAARLRDELSNMLHPQALVAMRAAAARASHCDPAAAIVARVMAWRVSNSGSP